MDVSFDHPVDYNVIGGIGSGRFGFVALASRQAPPPPPQNLQALSNGETPMDLEDDGPPQEGNNATEAQQQEQNVQAYFAIKKIEDFLGERIPQKQYRTAYLRRVCREMHMLEHFNVVPEIVCVAEFYTGLDGKDMYIVMPYFPHTLHDMIYHPDVEIAEAHIRWIMTKILIGIAAMQHANCLHRDLKPENILINIETWDLCIADFGLSRAKEDLDVAISLNVVTLPYRAPEILLYHNRYDHAIDVWSAACIMAELALRTTFLPGKDILEQVKEIIGRATGLPADFERSWKGLASESAYDWVVKLRNDPANAVFIGSKSFTDIFPMLSRDAVEVISAMLRFNPWERPSAQDILHMNWFAQDPDCLTEIRNFFEQTQACVRQDGVSGNIESMEDDELVRFARSKCSKHENFKKTWIRFSQNI